MRSVTTEFIEPMKARLVRELPAGDWLYEMKVDGYRVLAFKAGKGVRLMSRNGSISAITIPRLSIP